MKKIQLLLAIFFKKWRKKYPVCEKGGENFKISRVRPDRGVSGKINGNMLLCKCTVPNKSMECIQSRKQPRTAN